MLTMLNFRKLVAPLSPEERSEVMHQLERLVDSHYFRNSRRYPDLIRYVVQQTLDGHPDRLKERFLGIDVFDREPIYDTASDSIVRVAAAEVRKRIAQYYQEEGHEAELRIELPSGSYLPHFWLPELESTDVHIVSNGKSAHKGLETAHLELLTEPTEPHGATEREQPQITSKFLLSEQPRRRTNLLAMFLLLTVATALGFVVARLIKPSAPRLWLFQRLLAGSQERALVCVGAPSLTQNQPVGVNGTATAGLGTPTPNNTLVPLSDAMTISILSRLLFDHGRESQVQLARDSSFSDLRSRPTVLVGAFDNPWTMRLTSDLPFRFVGTDGEKGTIVDHSVGDKVVGQVDFSVPYSNRTQDYAVIALTADNLLGRPVLILAGIGPNGTMAAAEFISDRTRLEALLKTAPKQWSGHNVELLLATQVIQGNSGPPSVAAIRFW